MTRSRQISQWRFEADNGDTYDVTTIPYVGSTVASVSVWIKRPDGSKVQFKGEGTVERSKTRPHDMPGSNELPVRKITFRSLAGDVEVSDRSGIRAAEAYATEALKTVVELDRRARAKLETVTATQMLADPLGQTFPTNEIVERDAGEPHEAGCTLFEDHPGRCRTLTARPVERDELGRALTRMVDPLTVIRLAARNAEENELPGREIEQIRAAAEKLNGMLVALREQYPHPLGADARRRALESGELVMNPPLVVDDAPAGAGEIVEAFRG